MIDYFLLKKGQVIGKNRLYIVKEGCISNEATDFALYKSRKSGVPNRCFDWWIGKSDKDIFAGIVNEEKNTYLRVNPEIEGYGIRPAVNYQDIKPFAREFFKDDKTIMATFGTYPQDYASLSENLVLNNLLSLGYLEKTNKQDVFKYKNGYYLKDEDNDKWIVESDLVWVIDRKTGIAVCDKIIDAGRKNYNEVVDYLNNSFGKLIFSEDRIKEYNAITNYNNLKAKKEETETKLNDINSLMSHLKEEILELRRKKN